MATPYPSFKSIWNEDPQVYLIFKTIYSSIASVFYPFSFVCVLKKSPQSFGSLKWFLLFHLICISIAWTANFLLIDYFYFVPSLVVRIDGFLAKFIDSWTLYQISYVTYGFSMASSQLIFCNRVFLIMNMYKSGRTRNQNVFECAIYFFVGLLPLSMIPAVFLMTPNQKTAKQAIIANLKIYPECVHNEHSVIICDPMNSCAESFAILNLVNVVLSTFIIFSATHVAYRLLSRRMMMKSEKTKRMHRKFNQRTFLQAIVVFVFAMFPILVANVALLFELRLAELSYFIDFLRENQPNASLLTLFLFYDPYQLYMITVLGYCRSRVKVSVLTVRSARQSVDVKSGGPN